MYLYKATLDTNILISGLYFGGTSKEILELGMKKNLVRFVYSKPIIDEFIRKSLDKFANESAFINSFVYKYMQHADVVNDSRIFEDIAEVKDKDDCAVLQTAYISKSDYLVTGDKKHLLSIKNYKGIVIISPSEFLDKTKYQILLYKNI